MIDEYEIDLLGVYLPLSAVGRRLGVSRSRVWQFVAEGRLRAVKIGREWLVDLAEVQRFEQLPRAVGNPAFRRRN